jgi:hypothetical protein
MYRNLERTHVKNHSSNVKYAIQMVSAVSTVIILCPGNILFVLDAFSVSLQGCMLRKLSNFAEILNLL